MSALAMGAALFVLLYTGYLWFRLRKGYYLYCCSFVMGFALLNTAQCTGSSQPIELILLSLSFALGAGFCRSFLSGYQLTTAAARLLLALMALNGFAALLYAIAPFWVMQPAALMLATATAGCGTIIAARFALQGHTPVQFFCAAWCVLTGASLVYALQQQDVLASSPLAPSLLLGSIVAQLLMVLALSERLYADFKQHSGRQLNAIRSAEKYGEELMRSNEELGNRNQRLDQLLRQADRLDGVTGLLSKTAFEHELDREYRTALRYGNMVSVLVLEISDLEQIVAQHGQHTADSWLHALAQAASGALLRAGDTAGRITGNRLAIVLPYTDIDGALTVIQRIKHCVQAWKQADAALSEPMKLRAGIASTENRLARHAEDLLQAAMDQIREIGD
jgi:diguanylate cyclase (GGDEF)-like protein